jgi:hypothetical protein
MQGNCTRFYAGVEKKLKGAGLIAFEMQVIA